MFLMVSCCWSLCYCDVPDVTNGVVGVCAVPFEHAVASGPAVTGFPAVDGVLAVAIASLLILMSLCLLLFFKGLVIYYHRWASITLNVSIRYFYRSKFRNKPVR